MDYHGIQAVFHLTQLSHVLVASHPHTAGLLQPSLYMDMVIYSE